MDSGECNKQEDAGDSMSGDSDLPKPSGVRYPCVQVDTITTRLLAYNVRVIWFCCPILWLILYFL